MPSLSGLKGLFGTAMNQAADKALPYIKQTGKDVGVGVYGGLKDAVTNEDNFTRYGSRAALGGLGLAGVSVPTLSALNANKRENLIQQSANILSEAEKNNRSIDYGSNDPFMNAMKLSAAVGIPSLALIIAAKMISNKYNKG